MDFWLEMIVSIIPAVIGGYVSYKIAQYQVNKSEKQQSKYREEDVERQKLFMVNELKLKTTENLLKATAGVNSNVLKMMDLGFKKHRHFLSHRITYHRDFSEVTAINLSVQQNFDDFQNYLSDLFTFIKLFNIDNKTIDIEDLKKKGKELYDSCLNENIYLTFDSENAEFEFGLYLSPKGDEVATIINDCDHIIRKNQIELIQAMQKNVN